ncbi:MAG: alpha-mannosidase 2c1, partial [Bacteroidota bacterium]
MKKHQEITIQRLERFLERLKGNYYYSLQPLEATYFKSEEPISWEDAQNLQFEPIEVGTHWGSNFECAWFRFRGTIPEHYKGKQVFALIDIGGEACRFDEQGNPIQGLTNKKISWTLTETIIKKRIKLADEAEGGEPVDIWIDAGANNILGLKNVLTYESMVDGIFNQAALTIFDHEKWQLRIDFELLLQIAIELPEYSRHRRLIIFALNEVCNNYGVGGDKEVALCRKLLKPELSKPANASALKVSAIGHAHIDIAWLWPLRETVRKTSRTFSTALRMMEFYPEYKFGASQPALYQMMKDHYPGLYDRVKQAVKNGQWECQGAMYVEADCNLVSGESLVRQVLYGKQFFNDEMDVEVNNLWLPDVFGYSAALPQILKKSDVDYFMTQKISWNQFNEFPYHTFWWEGIDGTKIYSHFLAPNNYRSDCSAMDLMNLERTNNETDRTDHALFLYGAGDGGGGPARIYIEKLKRVNDLEDMPQVEFEFAEEFFKKSEASARDLQTWRGELYLELHRGTLTTQAKTKKYNRQLERLLGKTEWLFGVYHPTAYPKELLDESWKILLLNQFHDIIPGTSISRVH